ncbi:hypothetical protein PAXRUDRAFT_833173 [Paxillus rubicundulus Ve08.2h10]|uniref:Unplaced genomic scaffold scaffold_4472, whole genome shotgun sequence n=1 Tax=Paxillus rubicundulus Ve08.2h10 TaxID=930991 RepID=A0A0D0D266_9AGAM|nr:hypothetical protein PAXRUDRAFT_836116 [Paxillus rubicundulus Ve08.2h10]KIK80999.1 hypothetical protein PAXRUDRAFT_833173 [Paxillus rubicundulus Ve08.2h10]
MTISPVDLSRCFLPALHRTSIFSQIDEDASCPESYVPPSPMQHSPSGRPSVTAS